MSSAPPRRSGRLAAKDDKASSSAPKTVVKRKAKAAPARKRARPASPEPDIRNGDNENESGTRKPRKRVKACASAESSGNAEEKSDEVVDAPLDHELPEQPTVAEASGSTQDESGNVEELVESPMDVVSTDERHNEANTVAESSGSHANAGAHVEYDHDDSFDLDLAAELENVNVEVHPPDRSRNALELLMEAPLDIVFEIFSHFEPVDLLQLSRTTKRLRAFLMSKSDCFAVWEGALQRMELPPVIGDFNEPQYASLVFDNFCSHCGNEEKTHIMWEVRMRLCEECLNGGTIMATEEQLRRGQYFGDRNRARELVGITPRFELLRSGQSHLNYHHRSTWEEVVKESSTLRHGSPEYAVWLGEKQRDYLDLEISCKKYEEWIRARDFARAEVLLTLLNNRMRSVITRLQADGWGEELQDPSVLKALERHRYVNVAKQLSDQTWEEIKPTLTELMSRLRIDLRRRKMQIKIKERTRLVEDLGRAYFATLPDTPHNPPPAALATYEPFLGIIKNTPHNEDATTQLTQAFEAVPALCENWRATQAGELKAMLRKEPGRSDDLSLVVNAFTCSARWHCQFYPTVLHYPHFASHMCFITSASVGETVVAVWSRSGMQTLSDGMYKFCVEIVRACGLDPATATAQDMDAADVFFRCQHAECEGDRDAAGVQTFTLMRWRTAMNHPHLKRLVRVEDDELLALGRAQERSSLENDLANSCAPKLRYCLTFVCMHCGVADTSRTARAEHLRSVHGLEGEVNTADHYRRSARYQQINEELIVVKKAMRGER